MKDLLKYYIVGLVIVLGTSCEDILDTEANNLLTNELAVEDYSGAQATLLGGYDRLRDDIWYYRRDFFVVADALADNLKQAVSNSSRLNGISDNVPYSHFNFWPRAYRVISSANFVLAASDELTDAPQEDINQLKGEAYFLRALAHFDLVRAYARNPNYPVGDSLGIPVIDYLPSPTQDFPERNTIQEVYDQVISDLLNADTLVSSSLSEPININRASRESIHALLSRVYLYAGNWEGAEREATWVIDSARVSLGTQENYVGIFSEQSETLFGISFLQDENPGLNGSLQGILFQSTGSEGYGDFVVREDLLAQYEDGDVRSSFFVEANKSGEAVTYVGKYLGYGGAFGLDTYPLIRLSEMYLNRAEARAEIGENLGGATADINIIRDRAGLAGTIATGQAGLIEAALQERRLELAFEGHRYFDLKRRGLDLPKGSGSDCQSECSISYDDFRVIAPIPVGETDVNNNLEQNPGY